MLVTVDHHLKRGVAIHIVQAVNVRVAAGTELESQPVLEEISMVLGHNVSHDEFNEKLDAHCVQKGNDIRVILSPTAPFANALAHVRRSCTS